MPAWVLPVALAGASALSNYLNQNNGPKRAPSGPAIPKGWEGFSPGGGGSSSNTTSTSNTNYNRTTTPFITPEYTGLAGLIRQQMEARLNASSALPQGYQETGIRDINDTYNKGAEALTASLMQRGLLGSPAEGAGLSTASASRLSDIGRFRSAIPMMERDARSQDWGLIQSFIEAFGRGERETGSSTTNSSSRSSSSGGGGGASFKDQMIMDSIRNASGQPKRAEGASGPNWMQSLMSSLVGMYGSGAFDRRSSGLSMPSGGVPIPWGGGVGG